jgi:hypothetical protein
VLKGIKVVVCNVLAVSGVRFGRYVARSGRIHVEEYYGEMELALEACIGRDA